MQWKGRQRGQERQRRQWQRIVGSKGGRKATQLEWRQLSTFQRELQPIHSVHATPPAACSTWRATGRPPVTRVKQHARAGMVVSGATPRVCAPRASQIARRWMRVPGRRSGVRSGTRMGGMRAACELAVTNAAAVKRSAAVAAAAPAAAVGLPILRMTDVAAVVAVAPRTVSFLHADPVDTHRSLPFVYLRAWS